jgi:hypothetical protein
MRILCAIVPLVLFALLAPPCRADDAPDANGKDRPASALPYTRIGVVLFMDDSRIHHGGEQFTEILLGRLNTRIKGVEFVMADPHEIGIKAGPLQPDEARELGAKLDVQALLDGIFSGVDIVGGTWPSLANDVPQAKGQARWRLLDAGTGVMARDGLVDPKRPKIYSRRVRNTDDLVRRVMQDMAEEICTALEAGGTAQQDEQRDKPAEKDRPLAGSAEGEAK